MDFHPYLHPLSKVWRRFALRSTTLGACLAVATGACDGDKAEPAADGVPSPVPAADGARPAGETPTPAADGGAEAGGAADDATATAKPDVAVVEEEDPTRPPADYGIVRTPLPPPDPATLTRHALVGYEVVAIYAKPDTESRRLGYMRLGQRTKVTPKVEGGTGCRKGWHGLPNGGFACASKGLVVEDKPPYMRYAPPPPRLDTALPYDYAYVRKWNAPMWWRIPTSAELTEAEQRRAKMEEARDASEKAEAAAAAGGDEPTPTPPGDAAEKAAAAPKLPKPEAADKGGDKALPQVKETDAPKAADDKATAPKASEKTAAAQLATDDASPEPEEEAPEPMKLPLNPEKPWLEKGFFVSLAEKMKAEVGTFWRTARGGFVHAKHVYGYDAKDFKGVELGDDVQWPVGWVMVKETHLYELRDDDTLQKVKKVERRELLDLDEEVEVAGKDYFRTRDGLLVKKKVLRLPERVARPEGIEPYERWIDVDLSTQSLIAYEGDTPVYVTLVSTGKKGSKEEPFDTPTGRWRVVSKHVSTTMAGDTASDGNYSIQDVPWTMFFEGSYALHGAFWHRNFGYVRSHGCVNLGPSDARWLFMWSPPFLPEGWHGVKSDDANPGVTVIVHE